MLKQMILGVGAVLLICLGLLRGPATPVGVNRVPSRKACNDTYANPFNAGVLSGHS